MLSERELFFIVADRCRAKKCEHELLGSIETNYDNGDVSLHVVNMGSFYVRVARKAIKRVALRLTYDFVAGKYRFVAMGSKKCRAAK